MNVFARIAVPAALALAAFGAQASEISPGDFGLKAASAGAATPVAAVAAPAPNAVELGAFGLEPAAGGTSGATPTAQGGTAPAASATRTYAPIGA